MTHTSATTTTTITLPLSYERTDHTPQYPASTASTEASCFFQTECQCIVQLQCPKTHQEQAHPPMPIIRRSRYSVTHTVWATPCMHRIRFLKSPSTHTQPRRTCQVKKVLQMRNMRGPFLAEEPSHTAHHKSPRENTDIQIAVLHQGFRQ